MANPVRPLPESFTVAKDCVVNGRFYPRGEEIPTDEAAGFHALNRLVSARYLVPTPRAKTDDYGFGDDPRVNARPTYFSPKEREFLVTGGAEPPAVLGLTCPSPAAGIKAVTATCAAGLPATITFTWDDGTGPATAPPEAPSASHNYATVGSYDVSAECLGTVETVVVNIT